MQRWGRGCSVTIISRPWATKVKRIFSTFPVYDDVENIFLHLAALSQATVCSSSHSFLNTLVVAFAEILILGSNPAVEGKYLKFVWKMCFCHIAKILSRNLNEYRTLSPLALARPYLGRWDALKVNSERMLLIWPSSSWGMREATGSVFVENIKSILTSLWCVVHSFFPDGRRARQWKGRLDGSILLNVYFRWEPE